MSLSQNLSRSIELSRSLKTNKLGKRCLTCLSFRRQHVTKGELELVVNTATNHVQKMTRKNSIRVTVPINLPLSRTWITHGYVWRIRWCEINSVSLINIGVWESMLRNPNDKQIHDTFQLLIPCDLTFYGNVIEVILGLQFAVYETFDWALSFSGVLRDKLK